MAQDSTRYSQVDDFCINFISYVGTLVIPKEQEKQVPVPSIH